MAIEFDGKGNIVGTTPDGVIAVKLYSLEKQIAELKSQLQQKDKEIERLKEELEFEKSTNKELISTGAELENKLYEEQDKNKRLNNIINELERYLEKTIIDGGTRGSMTFWYRQIYDYLQELKGSDKE